MGLLSQGKPLDWDETKKYARYVQERGIAQFINIYNVSKDRVDGPFKWGDEVEYILVKFDQNKRVARVSLKAEDVFHRIAEQQIANNAQGKSSWNPEFASYMVEGTPGIPYGADGQLVGALCEIEENMRYRRHEVMNVLEPDETVMSITSFPRLGCPQFTYPIYNPKPEQSASGSLFFPDEAIYNGHPRFKTLVKNIRSRRRRKVIINLPIYKDLNTPDPFVENCADEEARQATKPNHVYMDAMGFGMGCCCLQVTLQATDLEEAKELYDQLAPITPIALALSAASPVYKGYLTDRDCRWDVISCAVDDRTKEESGETRELGKANFRIPKSRYDSISCYLSRHGQKYNDSPLVFDKKYYETLVANKVEPSIARHIAHLFIRDPITLYKEKLDQTDAELDHFENIQSTNWQTMRFKPPPAVNSPIGWRVEFRPCEAQTSDFENAAFVVFVTLLSRVILAYKLNFLMPISLMDKNMVEAQKRDAVREAKFWFRRDIWHRSSSKNALQTVLENRSNKPDTCRAISTCSGCENCATLMTANQIINGKDGFIGIMPIIWHYVESLEDGSNADEILQIKRYLKFISDRASLKTKTTARFIREFIDAHPMYDHDSVINDEVNFDLLAMLDKIGKSELAPVDLMGEPLDASGLPPKPWGETHNGHHHHHQQASPASSSSSSSSSSASKYAATHTGPHGHGESFTVKKTSLCNGLGLSKKSSSTRVSRCRKQ